MKDLVERKKVEEMIKVIFEITQRINYVSNEIALALGKDPKETDKKTSFVHNLLQSLEEGILTNLKNLK